MGWSDPGLSGTVHRSQVGSNRWTSTVYASHLFFDPEIFESINSPTCKAMPSVEQRWVLEKAFCNEFSSNSALRISGFIVIFSEASFSHRQTSGNGSDATFQRLREGRRWQRGEQRVVEVLKITSVRRRMFAPSSLDRTLTKATPCKTTLRAPFCKFFKFTLAISRTMIFIIRHPRCTIHVGTLVLR